MTQYCNRCHPKRVSDLRKVGYTNYELCHDQKHLYVIDQCVDVGISNFIGFINSFAKTYESCQGDDSSLFWFYRYPWVSFDDPREYGKVAGFIKDSQDLRWGTLYDFSERATLHESDVIVRIAGTNHQLIFAKELNNNGYWERQTI